VLLNHTKRIQWNEISDVRELGSGAYGSVQKGMLQGSPVAIKQVHSAEMLALSRPQTFALFLQECWAMNFLQHPKIITLVGVCFQPMSMVLEFMELGDLRKFLDGHPDLAWPTRISLLSDIAEGMAYAHSQWPPIIHKDLKSPNVFLTMSNGRVTAKVADLGLAEVLPKTSKVQGVDNPIWAAVEIIQGGLCTEKVDVWSFSIMVRFYFFISSF
jgi:serine/threonine protein kinase